MPRLSTFVLLLPVVALAKPHIHQHARLHKRDNGVMCGVKGYDDGEESYQQMSGQTYASCAAACQADSDDCESFSFGSGECNLYDVSVEDNFVKNNGSPYQFYDSDCIGRTTTTTTTTTTKKTTTTVKSTTTNKLQTTNAPTTTTAKMTKSTTTSATACPASPPCAYPTWVIHDFVFFNSSHNLDCAGTDSKSQLCQTGKSVQPSGYGPPDRVSAVVDGIGSCYQQNPGTTPSRSIGDNVVRCAGSQQQLSFYGSSLQPSSKATFLLQNQIFCQGGMSYTAYGGVTVPMSCTYDAGKNATCTVNPSRFSVVASSFDNISG